jgi:hypothetical protein
MPLTRKLIRKNKAMLSAGQKKNGYMYWWHSFTGEHAVTGEKKSFFIGFFILNPARSPDIPVFGQLYSQKTKEHMPSYIMIKAGVWGENAKQIHQFFPSSELKYTKKTLGLNVGSIHLTETELSGSVQMSKNDAKLQPEYMSDSGSMSWNLTMKKECPYDVGFCTSTAFSSLNIFDMYWHVQGIKTAYTGTVTLDEDTYKIRPDTSFGYADKNWGKNFTSPRLWLSSNNLVSEISGKTLKDTCFDIGGVGPKFLGLSLNRKLLACFYYEGIKYDFNFTKHIKKSKVTFEIRENDEVVHWLVSCTSKKYLLDVDIYCKKSEMLWINYEAPSGEKFHNHLWNGGTGYGELKFFMRKGKELEQVESALIQNCGCEYGVYDQLDL